MTEFEPRNLAQTLLDHGNEWADRKAAADLLEETQKTRLAQIALKYITEGAPVNKATMEAQATEEYSNFLNDMVEARRLANRARVQYDADITFIEMQRSLESTKREEMKMR